MSDEGLYRAVKQYDEYGKIIPCKDCKYFEQDTGNYGVCIRFNDTAIADDVVKANDFCSRAKEKDGDDK